MEKKEETSIQPVPSHAQSMEVVGVVKDLRHADAALEFLRTEGFASPMSAEDEKRLRSKIDWRVVPLMLATYLLQYLDKTLVNYANVMGLQRDTHITGDQFSQLAMIFYVSYLAVCHSQLQARV